ncbi:AT-rich interactive domain-containing protein 2 isoform X9 [Zootermopsis nevadensis]|uniref:AT-rich interactive domain-containing protein 2 isoform X9 n=1 Tax=Zootermopsis nevadensis TaxID=136037 RepID=UPI000B8ECA1D|nr:AT-rich interactive domain-containing protein 2 isoform X9 [Zootermopsis nevadensis]
MAKILNKDPVTYQRERDGFIRDLKHFHETRGTPFRKVPQINGREIDLYLLYVLVTAHGGWVKVNSRNEWESLVEHFSLPKQCANCGVGLKQIYLRHLDRYEKVHYLGEDVERGSDDDEETRHRRWSARALHCVPLTYNHHQHNVADALRSYNGLSADLYRASDYDRLALSLVSPLPNEQDFALNVCTLLSNEGKHTLKLDKYPRLIDFLLAHAGVFNHSSTRDLFEEVYRNLRKHSLKHFWPDALADLDLCDLADETLFPTKKPKVKEVVCEADGNAGLAAANSISDRPSRSSSRCSDGLEIKTGSYSDIMEKMDMELLPGIVDGEREGMVDSATSMEVDVSDLFDDVCAEESVEGTETSRHEFYEEGEDGLLADVDANDKMSESRLKVPLKIEPSDLELFCLGRSFGTQDYVGQRVLQVATILRNLSFGEENVVTLARSGPFLRFLLLCAGSRWNSLHQLGLDMLGNVAHEVLMEDPGTDRLAACMLSSVSRGLHSQDRLVILSCLEVLNKLSQKDENEDIMLRYLDQHVYDQVCTFLTLHDIMLLIYTLECLYSLSSLGERACNCIVRVHGAIDTLVSLITVEAQSYGPKACILMRVVETVSGTQAGSTTTTNTTSTAMAAGTQNPNPPAPIVSTPVRPPAATTPQRQSTPQRVVIGAPQPAVATPVSLTTAQTPQQYQQQQHAHQQAAQENEQFALAWLRATFEPATGCRIEQAELYKQYLNACAKIGRRGVIAPLHFPRCVRSVFGGTIGPNPQKQPGGMAVSGSAEQPGTNSLMFYEGIKVTQRQQQQRLLQQQLQSQKMDSSSPPPLLPPSTSNSVQGKGVGNITSKSKPSAAAAAGVATTTTTTVKSPDPRQRVSRINGARTPLQVQSQTTPLQAQTQTQAQLEPLRDAAGENSSNGSCSMASSIITTATQCVVNPGVITQIPTRVITENHVPSPALAIGGGNLALRGRREPPQPPPPPLAPLSNSCLPSRLDVEDSDSTGNNSLASSSRDCSGICTGNISSTDDGDNSLTSFEGLLLNGIPHSLDIDAASNDSSSKDSARSSSQQQNPKPAGTKSLMLADLLEKKVDKKEPPILNGVLGKELRIGEKGLELVENHLEKVLKESSITQTKSVDVKETSKNVGGISDNCSESIGVVRTVGQVSNNLAGVPNNEKGNTAFKTVGIGTTDEPLMGNSVVAPNEQVKYGVMTQQTQTVQTLKRPAAESLGAEDGVSEAKRPHLSPESVMNGTSSPGPISAGIEQNPGPLSPGSTDKSTSSSASADNTEAVNASPSAANLYAALAASALEDEPELELPPPPPTQVLVQSASGLRQAVFLGQGVESGPQQQLIVTAAPRQIIVSQGQLAPQGQVLITAGGQLTLQQGPNAATATIKTPTGHQAVPVLVQTGGSAAQRTQISAVTHSQGAQLMQAGQVVLSQSSSGQFILSQAPAQGQVQLVQTSSGQGGQYIVSTSSSSGQAHYVVAQPQTALVQGQTQTVLVAQTPQQQGTGTKTIIILQPQSSSSATHHQKVVVTPQGQPVVVTQVPRPILQSPAISNPPSASIPPPALVPTSSAPPQPPLSPASPSLQPVKHVSTSTVATSTNTTPVHIPSRVASTGTSTSLPPAQPLTRAITPTNLSTTTLAPVSPSPVTATKTNAKPPTVHPTAVPAIPRPPLSPSPTALNSPRATPVQPPKQTRTLPNTRPQSSSTPVTETNSDKSTLQNTVRSSKPPCQPTPPQTRLMTAGSIVDQAIFLCEWRGCMRSFKSANEVYMHACEAHCPLGSEEIQCLWERCDAMKRKRFSLMTHLYDRHCNADVLRMMAVRRRQLSQSGRSEIPPPQPPPPHPGYAPNAAFHAIKRHALEFVNPKEMMTVLQRPTKPGPPATIPARTGPSPPEQEQGRKDDNEGPVTKSIRLTSSLILRNLVIYSTNGKRFLRSYEPHLASVALSNVESSRTIAQVLYDMNQQTSQR